MRDPNRIDNMLLTLALVWRENPDLRLGQLIVRASKAAARKPSEAGFYSQDSFYVEDDVILKGLEQLLSPVPEVEVPLFYIMNRPTLSGNSVLWWRVDGHGYTDDLAEAWKLNGYDAARICAARPGSDFRLPVDLINSIAQRHVRLERLREVSGMNL